jgi:hypothetical protein
MSCRFQFVMVNVVKQKIMWSSSAKIKEWIVVLFCSVSVVVAISLVATDMICLHDVSLMCTCVESAH